MKRVLFAIVLIISSVLLQAETITYAVTDRNTVTATGVEPAGGNVQLNVSSTTGQITRITAGNSISITLQNWTGVTINALTLSMHSNTKAGAGTITVTCGNRTLYNKSGSFKDIAGAYSTAFVNVNIQPLQAFTVAAQEDVCITVSATENSLYVESFAITYIAPTPPPAVRYTVKFKTNTPDYVLSPLTEIDEGQGVILPNVPYNKNGWVFVGWTTQPCEETSTKPMYYLPETRFYPTTNTTLYALYSEEEANNDYQQETVFAGEGSYYWVGLWGQVAYAATNYGARGSINVLNAVNCPLKQYTDGTYFVEYDAMPGSAKLYRVHFQSDSTLTLTLGNTAIGYDSSNSLCNTASVWRYTVLEDNALDVYYERNGLRYTLQLTFFDVAATIYGWNILRIAGDPTGIVLLRVPEVSPETMFTGYPEGEPYDALPIVNALNISITNDKILNLSGDMLCVYTVTGSLICSSQMDIDIADWHAGAYIVCNAMGQGQVFIHK